MGVRLVFRIKGRGMKPVWNMMPRRIFGREVDRKITLEKTAQRRIS
jgi:hypothetical protein